jgi:capsular polysaccharide export protein
MKFHILLDNVERSKVFFRLYSASLRSDNVEVAFYTLKPSIYFYYRFIYRLKNIYLISKIIADVSNVNHDKDIHVLIGRSNIALAEKIYSSVYNYLELNAEFCKNDIAIVFNGCHTAGKSFHNFFRDKSVSTLTCEISNLPGKMIFDPIGVNAQSILYNNVELLDNFEANLNDAQHLEWVKSYEKYKTLPIPQSKIKYKHAFFTFLDSFFYILNLGVKEECGSLLRKIKLFLGKVKGNKGNMQVGEDADLELDYYFYPTQVSTDTQILINSDVDNFFALESLITEANKDNKKAYVKVHPAEQNLFIINKYLDLERSGAIKLCKNNTTELIKNAKKVYTINSTVGLEALIYEKDIEVFGRAIYSNMRGKKDLYNFLHGYLVNLDYYGSEAVNTKIFETLQQLSVQVTTKND